MSTDQPDRLTDLSLTCATCGVGFVLTVGEQVFFRSKAMHTPKRCKPCRQARAAEQRVSHRGAVDGRQPRHLDVADPRVMMVYPARGNEDDFLRPHLVQCHCGRKQIAANSQDCCEDGHPLFHPCWSCQRPIQFGVERCVWCVERDQIRSGRNLMVNE